MTKKKQLSEEDLINLWMKKYYNTTIEEEYIKNPWKEPREFYDRYQCTQEQHDEWEVEAKKVYKKTTGLSDYAVKRYWGFTYLNVSPRVKKL